MKPGQLIVLLILVTFTRASQKLNVLINNNADVPLAIVGPAETFAARILASADITLTWHTRVSSSRKGLERRIILDLAGNAPDTDSKDALGYSLVHEGVHASIFYDGIRQVARENQQTYVLAHAMAHEIARLLQGVPHHSTTGVMKGYWDQREIFDTRHLLAFTPEDVRMIRNAKEPSYWSRKSRY